MIMKINLNEPLPVSVYCTIQKKCVLIFSSSKICDKYVFPSLVYTSSRTRYLTTSKGKTDKNVFKTLLAFRYSSQAHKDLLGNEDLVVLDDKFYRDSVKLTSMLRNKGDKL